MYSKMQLFFDLAVRVMSYVITVILVAIIMTILLFVFKIIFL